MALFNLHLNNNVFLDLDLVNIQHNSLQGSSAAPTHLRDIMLVLVCI